MYQHQPQQNYGHGGPPPPQVPPGWRAQWDPNAQRYYFVNEQTGQSQWDLPQGQFYQGPPGQPYGQQNRPTTVAEDQRGQKQHGSGLGWGMAGAAAGLVGGALLMHEGHEIKEHWREDEYRAEDRVDGAARWTGEKVQEVEDIPQDVEQGFDRFGNRVEQGWDNTVDYVEDTPDRLAYDAGEVEGRIDRFGDGIQDSYEDGKYDARNDDYNDDNNDRW